MHLTPVRYVVAWVLYAVFVFASSSLPSIKYLQESPHDITVTWTKSDVDLIGLELEFRSVQPGAETETEKIPLDPSSEDLSHTIPGLNPNTWYLVCLSAVAADLSAQRKCKVRKTMLVNGSLSDSLVFDWVTHIYHDHIKVVFSPKTDVPFDHMTFDGELFVTHQDSTISEFPKVNKINDREIEFSGPGVQPDTVYKMCIKVVATMSEVTDLQTKNERCLSVTTAKKPAPTSAPASSADVLIANLVTFALAIFFCIAF